MACSTTRKALLLISNFPDDRKPAFDMMLTCGKTGCSQCGFGMAYCRLNGYGCYRNIPFARELLSEGNLKLLSEGKPECSVSQYMTAWCFDTGLGVDVDKVQAFALYHQSALAGFASAQHELGLIYSIGEGVPQNFEQSMHWYKLAAQQGLGCSMFFIGLAYERGEGVEVSNKIAKQWYLSALVAGYDIASGKLRKLVRE